MTSAAPRVLFTNMSRMWGGTEHHAVELAKGLRARGCAVRFLWGHEVVGERVREAGLDGARLRLRGDADLPGLLRLARELRRFRADVVVPTKWREYLLGGLAARLAGTPRTVIALGLRVSPRGDLKRRLIFRLADRVLVNAEEIRDGLAALRWFDASRVRVIHNGVDLARFADLPDRSLFRVELGVPLEAPLLVNIGALTPQKDHDLLLRAATLLVPTCPDLHVAIVGEGFLRPKLESRVRDLGLEGRVHLCGFRRDVLPVYAAADLFVLSSDNEGMAWVLLEALAAGLPIVATDVSGVRACVREGENGRIVPVHDDAALAAAIDGLLEAPRLRGAMGAASRRLAVERFDRNRMIDDTLEVLAGRD